MNSSIEKISTILARNNIVQNKIIFNILFRVYCLFSHTTPKAGEYIIKSSIKTLNLIRLITSGSNFYRKITVLPGSNVRDIISDMNRRADIVSDANDCATSISDGDLIPDTYFFLRNTTREQILHTILCATDLFLDHEWSIRDTQIDNVIKTKRDAVILASIIEMEIPNTDIKNMKIAAGIYIKRLMHNMPLQACPTVIYGLRLDNVIIKKLSYDNLQHNSPYNTYKIRGLPPTPICNPSRNAIMSVLHPTYTDYWYMISPENSDGKVLFTKTFSSHVREKRKSKSQ